MIVFHSIYKSLSAVTISWAAFIVISASFMRQLLNLTLTLLTRNQVSALIYIGLVLAGLLVIWLILKQGSVRKIILAAIPLGFIAFLSVQMPLAEERVHIFKYGLLGFLATRDILKSHQFFIKSVCSVLVFGFSISVLDEGFQALLPYRVGDLRDVGFDCLSLIAGLMIYIIAYGKARAYPT